MSLKKLLKNAQSNLTAIASPLRLALVAVGSFLLLFQPIAFASTKLSAEAVIDQIFRSEVPLPGGTAEQHQNMSSSQSSCCAMVRKLSGGSRRKWSLCDSV
ncbi:MAG: hypothetical protein WA828_00815 [Coleofasciculaceae cyanobacterium]